MMMFKGIPEWLDRQNDSGISRLRRLSAILNSSPTIQMMVEFQGHLVNKWVRENEDLFSELSEEFMDVLQPHSYVYVNKYYETEEKRKQETIEMDEEERCESIEDYDKFYDNPMGDHMDWFWRRWF
tara:strand:+ start:249 stop:626 length:378 start_codon:yes stop_codon:yes gene_type:complete